MIEQSDTTNPQSQIASKADLAEQKLDES